MPLIIYAVLSFIVAWTGALYTIRNLADFSKMEPGHVTDYLAQVTGAEIVRGGDIKRLYDPRVQLGYQQKIAGKTLIPGPSFLSFRTPPTTAYLYSLLPIENRSLSFWILVFINSLCVVAGIWLLSSKVLPQTLLIGTLAAFSATLLLTFTGGQPTGIVFLLTVLAFYAIKRNRNFAAGVLMALLFIKPNLLLIAGFMMLLLKDRKVVFTYLSGFLITLAFLVGLNLLLYGSSFLRDYVTFVANSELEILGTSIANNTNISAVVNAVFGLLEKPYNGLVASVVTLITDLIIFLVLLKSRGKITNEQLFAIICFVLPILNLHTNYPDLITHLATLAIVAPIFFKEKRWFTLGWLLFIIIELSYYSIANLEWLIALIILGTSLWLLNLFQRSARRSPLKD